MTLPRILFFGTPAFAAIGLQALIQSGACEVAAVVTQPDRPAGRGKSLQKSPVKELAELQRIPILQPENIRRSETAFLEAAAELGPFDLGVVIAFGQILPASVLALPLRNCINVHASLLPRWRGAAPIQRAILAGDTETGVGLMRVEAGLDTGPVYSETRVKIDPADTFETLHDALAKAGAALLVKHLSAIARGELRPTPQSGTGITQAAKLSNAESRIIWSAPALEVDRLVRALSPVPGAFTCLSGKRIKVFRGAPEMDREQPVPPGTIIECSSDTLQVQCGLGSFRLVELQLEGKKRLAVKEFLRGFPLSINMAFE